MKEIIQFPVTHDAVRRTLGSAEGVIFRNTFADSGTFSFSLLTDLTLEISTVLPYRTIVSQQAM
jgi:hypothetical protein